MPRNNTEPYRVINFFDWTGGIQDRRKNPLAFPHNALMGGENVELVDGGLKTRGGISIVSAGSLPDGEVMALKQVRFPTNETSALVVQVRQGLDVNTDVSGQEGSNPGTMGSARTGMAVAHDTQNDYIWVYGGALWAGGDPLGDLWYFDIAGRTWHEVTDDIGRNTDGVVGADMIYDPVDHRLILFGGSNFPSMTCNRWWSFDIETRTWSQFSPIGDNLWDTYWFLQWPSGRIWQHRLVYREATHSVLVMGGKYNGETRMPAPATYVELNLETMVTTVVTATGGPTDPPGIWALFGTAYDVVSDTLVIMEQSSGEVWSLDCATKTYTQLASLPSAGAGPKHPSFLGLAYCGGNYYAWGTDDTLGYSYLILWGFTGTEWTEAAITPGTVMIDMSFPIVHGNTVYLICGFTYNGVDYNGIPVEGAAVFEGVCSFDPETGGVGTAKVPGSFLYACPDHLPTTTGVFEQIYDLGVGAGVCSFAVLNDRLVVTEGIAAPPLVTGLSLSNDASDWLVPKAVLVSQDGVNYYDVSPQVCDKDPDTIANIGNIRSSGALFVCTDMPQVEAFWFEMETPNTLSAGEGPTTITGQVSFTANTDITRKDLKATIDHWVQDSGATGHFENDSNTPLTLGPGNDCPEVVEGVIVSFADADVYIKTITDDGEGSGEVELTAAHANGDVNGIYGIAVAEDVLTVKGTQNGNGSTWSASPTGTGNMSSFYCVRNVVSASDLTIGGDAVRLTFTGPATNNTGVTFTDNKPVLVVVRASIVERSGSTWNGTTTPTLITFNGGQLGFSFTDWGQSIQSDLINFAIDETKDYLVTLDFGANTRSAIYGTATSSNYQLNCNLIPSVSGKSGYLIYNEIVAMGIYWAEQQTISSLYIAGGGGSSFYGLTDITVYTFNPQPQNTYVAHTSDDVQFPIIMAEDFQGVTVAQSKPGDSVLWHMVSKDKRASFQVFKDSEWRICVKEDGGLWKYLDGSDVWQNATEDTLLSALSDAFAITENQMSEAELETITSAQWKGTDGIQVHITEALDFAVAMKADENNAPELMSYSVILSDYGTTHVYGWKAGDWAAGDGWDDNTVVSDIPWAQSGTVEYLGAAPFEADYSVLNEVPGYWYKFVPSGTSSDCAITRILYKAPCQPLSNIGDGQPDVPMGFVYVDTSDNLTRDYTVEVSDNALTELSKASVPMAADDYLYVGFCWPFNEIEVTPYAINNTNPAVLSAEYWNGEAWTSLTVTDGTKGSQGKTLSGKGKISWSLPVDWRANIPFDGFFSRGYWIRFSVSAALSSAAAISEVRIYSVPPRLHKYKFAAAVKDRIALLSRPDAWDQADLSRTLEEYGFSGPDNASYRIGGMDQIQCAVAAWNGLLVGKTETWHQLLGCDPSNFAFEGVEAARHIPVNSNVIVKAPMTGLDSGTRSGLFFLNRFGAFVSTGLHTDSEWNTGRGSVLSDSVNWWDGQEIPRLALDSLHRACGEYWPVKNWIVWAVPMITEPGQTVQTTNNRLIVYDLSLRTWLPPFSIALASIAVAYHHNKNAPGKLGEIGLYGGDYHGRIVRLFGPSDSTDLGAAIPGWVETGWLHFGSPEWLKLIRRLRLFGRTAAGKTIGVKIWVDGNTDSASPDSSLLLSDLDIAGSRFFALEEESLNLQGRFFKFRIEFQDITHIYGLQIGVSLIREWGAL